MKNLKMCLFLLALFLISACDKDEIDFKERQDNIVGTWDVHRVIREIRSDTLYAESGSNFEIIFNSDGTGSNETFLNTIVDFEWYYQFDPERIVIVTPQQGSFFEDVRVCEILKNEPDKQIWTYDAPALANIADYFENTWNMTKE